MSFLKTLQQIWNGENILFINENVWSRDQINIKQWRFQICSICCFQEFESFYGDLPTQWQRKNRFLAANSSSEHPNRIFSFLGEIQSVFDIIKIVTQQRSSIITPTSLPSRFALSGLIEDQINVINGFDSLDMYQPSMDDASTFDWMAKAVDVCEAYFCLSNIHFDQLHPLECRELAAEVSARLEKSN